MKNHKANRNDEVFVCQITSSVLGAIESLLVFAKKQRAEDFDENQRQFLEDIKSVEDWYFGGQLYRSSSLWLRCLDVAVTFCVILLAFVGFLAIT
jgi:hypothetical protein